MIMNDIKITEIEEHEDGYATLQLDLDPETFAGIFNAGFIHLLKKGMENDIREMTDDERQRAKERSIANGER